MIWTKIRIIKSVSYLLIFLFNFAHFNLYADERIQAAIEQINIISKDLKTLEKAVYKSSDAINLSSSNQNINEDIMAKHLLKLNDIENQFRELTNRFEEINFKMDKLSKRVTKIQSDTQMRISDLEQENSSQNNKAKKKPPSNQNQKKQKGKTLGEFLKYFFNILGERRTEMY